MVASQTFLTPKSAQFDGSSQSPAEASQAIACLPQFWCCLGHHKPMQSLSSLRFASRDQENSVVHPLDTTSAARRSSSTQSWLLPSSRSIDHPILAADSSHRLLEQATVIVVRNITNIVCRPGSILAHWRLGWPTTSTPVLVFHIVGFLLP